MKRNLLSAALLTGCLTVWSVDLITEHGVPATKGTPIPAAEIMSVTPKKSATTAEIPYYQSFDTQDAMNEMTLVSSPSSKQWKWIQSCPTFNESCAKVETNYYSGVKAYMILPAMNLQPGEYIMEFDAWGQSDFNPEYIAAYCATGNELSDMSGAQEVVTAQQLQGYCYVPNEGSQSKQHLSGSVNISTPGTYYFAVASAKDGSGMAVFVDNISVEKAVTATAPGSVTEMTVIPDEAGALSAAISVKAPMTDVNGDPLKELNGVKIYRGSVLVADITAAPGATVTATDTPTEPGNYLYRAMGYNAGGDGEGVSVQSYVGHAAPANPTTFYATHGDSDLEVVLQWDTPLDVYGKSFATDEITYTLKCTKPENIDWFDLLVSDLTGNSYSFTAPTVPGDQAFLRFSLVAKNKYGQESAVYFPDVRIPVGTPYTVPFAESFAGGNLSYLFRTKIEGNFGMWGLADDELYASYDLAAQDGDNGFILYAGMEDGDASGLYSGVIDLSGLDNPALSFYYYGQDTSNELVPLLKVGNDFEPLGGAIKMNGGEENRWNHLIYSLLPYKGKKIELAFRAFSRQSGFVALDNISIFDQLANDLTITASSPEKAPLGKAITVKANVSNIGAQTASGYSVTFYADGEEFATLYGEDIAGGSDLTLETSFHASADNGERTYTFHARVNYEADMNTANNESRRTSTRTVRSIHPAPRNLTAVVDGDAATFTWDEPDISSNVLLPDTESFENAEAWSDASACGWIIVDNDHGASGYFQDFDIPAVTGGEPASWFVIDGADENCSYYGLTPHSGKQALAVLYNADGSANDDWVISPDLSGVEQTVTFFARSYSGAYPDDFQVLYSNGSTKVEDFKPVPGATYNEVSSSWTEYVVPLPKGAKRFAIRYTSTNAFCLIVDDITFIPADGTVAEYILLGYNLYRDGEMHSSETILPAERSFVANGSDSFMNHSYHVTAIYSRYGESAPSNVIIPGVTAITAIESDSTTGTDIYYTTDGVRLHSTPTTNGIYIVRHADGTVTKVIR